MADSHLLRHRLSALRPLLGAVGLGLLVAGFAQPTQAATDVSDPAINLQSASHTDLPGSPSQVNTDQSLGVHAIKLRDGFVVLDNAVLLKTYVYAYSRQPQSDAAILTPNTEMIEPARPVIATAREKQQIDAMIAFDKAHPRLRIDVDDIALDPYVPGRKEYPIDNRLFIHDAGYYFDNSPYHYTYDHPEAFRHLSCTDAAVMKSIDASIASYVHFHLSIFATVIGADAQTQALRLRVDGVQLKDDLGSVLIDQKALSAPMK